MLKTCDACGQEIKGGISIGGTILCRTCAPMVEASIESVRAEGKPVSAARIAAKMRSETYHSYIIRDIPPELWERVQAEAARRRQSAKDFILDAIRAGLTT